MGVVLADFFGLESRAGAMIAGLVAGLTFHPLSLRIDRYVKRWFTAPNTPGAAPPSVASSTSAAPPP